MTNEPDDHFLELWGGTDGDEGRAVDQPAAAASDCAEYALTREPSALLRLDSRVLDSELNGLDPAAVRRQPQHGSILDKDKPETKFMDVEHSETRLDSTVFQR